MNPGLDRVLKHPLFVEKVGGTLHIAIGASYEHCYVEDPASVTECRAIDDLDKKGILNRSAQHVDIVTDFRPGGCGRSVQIDETQLAPRERVWEVASDELEEREDNCRHQLRRSITPRRRSSTS